MLCFLLSIWQDMSDSESIPLSQVETRRARCVDSSSDSEVFEDSEPDRMGMLRKIVSYKIRRSNQETEMHRLARKMVRFERSVETPPPLPTETRRSVTKACDQSSSMSCFELCAAFRQGYPSCMGIRLGGG